MRKFLAGLLVMILVLPVSAQIMAVHFKETKAAEKYRKYLVQVNGEYIVAGELMPGTPSSANPSTGNITMGKTVDLWVVDPGAPEKLPYKIDGEARVAIKGAPSLSIQRDDVVRMSFHMRDQTMAGLAAEYRLRLDGVDAYKKQRDGFDKTSREWTMRHGLVISNLERLRDWLASTLFPRAAQSLEKTILAEASAMKDDAVRARTAKAQKSIRKVEIHEDLVSVNQQLTGGKVKFKSQESQHVRIVHDLSSVSEQECAALLKLAETCIEGFRRELIDPYISEDFEDPIPEELFIEYWYGPDDDRVSDGFFVDYYGGSIDAEKEAKLQVKNHSARFRRGVNYLSFFQSKPETDHEGIITHGMGHALANILFNADGQQMPQDWLGEGAAYYMSFEFLGRNSVTCKDLQKRTYASDPGAEGLKSTVLGQRAAFNELALSKGAPIEGLATKSLHQMDDADLAKSWSMFDYIMRKEGLKGVRWLQSACLNARTPKGFIDRWREETAVIYEIKGQDPFKVVEDKWKAFAKSGQKKDESTRKVK